MRARVSVIVQSALLWLLWACLVGAQQAADATEECGHGSLHKAAQLGHIDMLVRCVTEFKPVRDVNELFVDDDAIAVAKRVALERYRLRKPCGTACSKKSPSEHHFSMIGYIQRLSSYVDLLLYEAEQSLIMAAWKYQRLGPPFGVAPLHVAAMHNQYKAASKLIELGAQPNMKTKDGFFSSNGQTALHLAALSGNLPVVEVLVDKGALVNYYATKGTPLLLAASGNLTDHRDVVSFLIGKGADCNATRRSDGMTALMIAAENDDMATANILLKAKCTAGIDGALVYATKKGNVQFMQRLFELGGSPHGVSGASLLNIAASRGNIGVVQLLLQLGADPKAVGTCMLESMETDCNAIQAAAMHGQDEISNLLTLHTNSNAENPQVLRNDGEL